jgi:hypothetical protein
MLVQFYLVVLCICLYLFTTSLLISALIQNEPLQCLFCDIIPIFSLRTSDYTYIQAARFAAVSLTLLTNLFFLVLALQTLILVFQGEFCKPKSSQALLFGFGIAFFCFIEFVSRLS